MWNNRCLHICRIILLLISVLPFFDLTLLNVQMGIGRNWRNTPTLVRHVFVARCIWRTQKLKSVLAWVKFWLDWPTPGPTCLICQVIAPIFELQHLVFITLWQPSYYISKLYWLWSQQRKLLDFLVDRFTSNPLQITNVRRHSANLIRQAADSLDKLQRGFEVI